MRAKSEGVKISLAFFILFDFLTYFSSCAYGQLTWYWFAENCAKSRNLRSFCIFVQFDHLENADFFPIGERCFSHPTFTLNDK